jgi:hypothetical protein
MILPRISSELCEPGEVGEAPGGQLLAQGPLYLKSECQQLTELDAPFVHRQVILRDGDARANVLVGRARVEWGGKMRWKHAMGLDIDVRPFSP